MPLIEVGDDVLAAMGANGIKYSDAGQKFAAAANSEAAMRDLLKGPHRTEFLKLYKQQYPDASVPEIDAAAPVLGEVEKLRKEFSEYRESVEKQAKERAEAAEKDSGEKAVAKGRSWLRRDKKLDDAGVEAVEKLMQSEGIGNYEVAFNHWHAQQPPEPAQLPSYASRSLDWFKTEEDQPDMQLLLKDPMAYRRKETAKIIAEARAGKLVA